MSLPKTDFETAPKLTLAVTDRQQGRKRQSSRATPQMEAEMCQ